MPNKSEVNYIRLLKALIELKPNLQPISIMTDFEKSAINAFHEVFPNSNQRGCFFHLSQCLWRRIQQTEELAKKYGTDTEFASNIRQLLALAFVPESDVVSSFESLIESQYFYQNEIYLQPIVDYFEDNWIGRLDRRNRRRQPPYPPSLWNCFTAVINDLPKTNNSVEGWHRGFNELLGAHHPSIWKFIDGLKKEQSLNELKIEQYVAGQAPPVRRRIYRDSADRIKSKVERYGNEPLLDYLRGIANNFQLQV
jgi:hypothetical protein